MRSGTVSRLVIKYSIYTLLFHSPETPIHAAFNHNGYGYIKRKDGDPMFHDHITRATSWFRAKIGSDGPRARRSADDENR